MGLDGVGMLRASEVPMPSVEQRDSKEEFARRGELIYARDIGPRTAPEDRGKSIVIDIETGAFEVNSSDLDATHRPRLRVPRSG